MKISLRLYALVAIYSLPLPAQHIESGKALASIQVAEGKRVFEMSCAVGYCHGLDGRAGKGPRLRDRVWSKAYLYQTIELGIPNSSMPAWQGRLTNERIDAVVSYIISISHEQTSPPTADNTTSAVKAQPVLEKDAALGKALFFDPLKDRNCGSCHRLSGSGTPVAADLLHLASRSDSVLLKQIEIRPARAQMIRVRLKEGDAICGTKINGTSSVLHVYDLVGDGPPVLRTIDPNSIVDQASCTDVNVHRDNSRSYTMEELASIVTFLKSIQ